MHGFLNTSNTTQGAKGYFCFGQSEDPLFYHMCDGMTACVKAEPIMSSLSYIIDQ